MNNEQGPRALTAPEAMQQIGVLEQQMQVMGANDFEPAAISRIKQQLEEGDITPQAAVEQMQKMLENKQDYH